MEEKSEKVERRETVREKQIEKAEFILGNLGLRWKDLEGKNVLDVGSGESVLASAATIKGTKTNIISLDIKPRNEVLNVLPPGVKSKFVQADAARLPFANESFDLVISHAAGATDVFNEGPRVLRPGGEIRQYPLYAAEEWFISHYLYKKKGWNRERVEAKIRKLIDLQNKFQEKGIQADPKEYRVLLDESLSALSKRGKLEVIEMLARGWAQYTGLPLDYFVVNPDDKEPTATLIYKKQK